MDEIKFDAKIAHAIVHSPTLIEGDRFSRVSVDFRTTDEANAFHEFVCAYVKLHNLSNRWASDLHDMAVRDNDPTDENWN